MGSGGKSLLSDGSNNGQKGSKKQYGWEHFHIWVMKKSIPQGEVLRKNNVRKERPENADVWRENLIYDLRKLQVQSLTCVIFR